MLFCSSEFLVFFAVAFTVYWATPWRQLRIIFLLIAGFYFYAYWNHWLALLVFGTTFIDYGVARIIDSTLSQGRRRFLLFLSITLNLGILAYFKYVDFFLHSLEAALRAANVSVSLPLLHTIVPIGISFYTFEAINYIVDVYRKKIPAERNVFHLLLFITFFPHLIAGPIVRAKDFLPQINKLKRWDWARLQLGLEFFLMGLFKKLAIADRMALVANPVFENPEYYNSASVWMGTVAYSLQIYCDFSGYTDMAIGIAHMFGYKLTRNFNMPYIATDISEFWKRWHISLSSWLRDYLYIPLGGGRGGRWLVYRNLLLTMALGGLWHGANWTFVAWGVVHGLLLVIHRMFSAWAISHGRIVGFLDSAVGTVCRISLTLMCVMLCWVFFRADTFTDASAIFKRLFFLHSGQNVPLNDIAFFPTILLIVICHMVAAGDRWNIWVRRIKFGRSSKELGWNAAPIAVLGSDEEKLWWMLPVYFGLLLVAVLTLLIGGSASPFIYTFF